MPYDSGDPTRSSRFEGANMPYLRRYGTATTVDGFGLRTSGAEDLKANPTLATGDVRISKDGGALANLATLPAVTPASSRLIEVSLSAAELSCKRATVVFVDQTGSKEWQDALFTIETFGDANAQITGFPPTATARIVVGSPLNESKTHLVLVKGCDYSTNGSNAIEVSGTSWPTLTGASIDLSFWTNDDDETHVLSKAGTVVTGTGDTKEVRIELTDVETGELAIGSHVYKWRIAATLSTGEVRSLASGTCSVENYVTS